MGRTLGADDAARTGAVVDDDGLAELLGEPHGDGTGHHVGDAARRKGHDQAQRLAWIALTEGSRRQDAKSGEYDSDPSHRCLRSLKLFFFGQTMRQSDGSGQVT